MLAIGNVSVNRGSTIYRPQYDGRRKVKKVEERKLTTEARKFILVVYLHLVKYSMRCRDLLVVFGDVFIDGWILTEPPLLLFTFCVPCVLLSIEACRTMTVRCWWWMS